MTTRCQVPGSSKLASGLRLAVLGMAEGNVDDASDETALIRRWLKSADDLVKRTVGKKGGERDDRSRPDGDADPGPPAKD